MREELLSTDTLSEEEVESLPFENVETEFHVNAAKCTRHITTMVANDVYSIFESLFTSTSQSLLSLLRFVRSANYSFTLLVKIKHGISRRYRKECLCHCVHLR